jgi:hypothetical protein
MILALHRTDQPFERPLHDGDRDPRALRLQVHGNEIAAAGFDRVQHAATRVFQIGQRRPVVIGQQLQQHAFEMALRGIDRVLRWPVFNFGKVIHFSAPRARAALQPASAGLWGEGA